MICDECETVAHCMKNGCVPKTIKKDEAFDPQDYIDPETGEPFNPVEQLDLFDFIAGALGVSRGTAYDIIREALAESALERMAENACELGLDYEQPAPVQQEPFGYFKAEPFGWTDCAETDEGAVALYTSPPAQRKPLHIGDESAEFKAWFDAWWVGDGEQGETIPTQSDKHFLTYMDQYTLGFGAWMAARHTAHGIKGAA